MLQIHRLYARWDFSGEPIVVQVEIFDAWEKQRYPAGEFIVAEIHGWNRHLIRRLNQSVEEIALQLEACDWKDEDSTGNRLVFFFFYLFVLNICYYLLKFTASIQMGSQSKNQEENKQIHF